MIFEHKLGIFALLNDACSVPMNDENKDYDMSLLNNYKKIINIPKIEYKMD